MPLVPASSKGSCRFTWVGSGGLIRWLSGVPTLCIRCESGPTTSTWKSGVPGGCNFYSMRPDAHLTWPDAFASDTRGQLEGPTCPIFHQPSNRHAAVFYKPRPAVLPGQGVAVVVDEALFEHDHRATEHYHHEHVQSYPAQCL